ncbi:hypothetical protein VTJ83DRAFT_2626 [Remersonia thermophila]|uniref:Xylulose kinase n=1 Tax=Remersonia thermophila TaxID=72144 RepID=A0ABR4DJG8_9PEZI
MSDGPLYLGLDLSTQQLKAVVIQSDLHVVADAKVEFDKDFGAKYGVTKGVIINKEEGEVFAPVAMWLESLDLVLERLSKTAPLHRIRGISGSCQQHGSVYWSRQADALLGGLTAEKPLVEQLKDAFSHPYGPNWQDHSTQHECDQFDAKLGSPERLAEVTGSAAHHRFTGPQIMRLRRKVPDMYANTSRISLVSSFLASLFLGSVAPIDISDVCGMDLWDIPGSDWSEPLLELTAGGADGAAELRRKLGEVRRDGGGSIGPVSSYFVSRYGFSRDCQVAPFTGDNPATILALPLRPLDAIVSLGTSTTFLMSTPVYKPDPSYHFFNHPTTPGQYMFMLCYKNGSLAREKVRDALPGTAAARAAGDDPWSAFNAAALATPPLDVRARPPPPPPPPTAPSSACTLTCPRSCPTSAPAPGASRAPPPTAATSARSRRPGRPRRTPRHRRVPGPLDAPAQPEARPRAPAGPARPAAPRLPGRRRVAEPGHRRDPGGRAGRRRRRVPARRRRQRLRAGRGLQGALGAGAGG